MSEDKNMTIIEVNGVKLEVDLREAKRVDHIRVGTRVKVLKKKYSEYKVYHGIIVGFEPFKVLPTIIVAVVEMDYQEAKIDFVYYNSESKDVEIVIAIDDDRAAIDKQSVIDKMDKEISKKESEIEELRCRKDYFLGNFKTYWSEDPLRVADDSIDPDTISKV